MNSLTALMQFCGVAPGKWMFYSDVDLAEYATEMYAAGNPIMSDSEFDELESRIGKRKVGAKPAFAKTKHTVPMGSLNKVQTKEELFAWMKGLGIKAQFILSDKMDGISISITYKNGELVQALTRGDGEFGEDITENCLLMKGVKRRIGNYSGVISGEVVIFRDDFAKYFEGSSNPRNSAAGAAKSLHDKTNCKHCTVVFYKVYPRLKSKSEEFDWLESVGLETPTHSVVENFSAVVSTYQNYIDIRRNLLPYEIDGLVVEINDTEKALSVGTSTDYPEYAVAFKFPHAEQETTIRSVEWQVGKTGRVTPVAVFDEVSLAGAKINRASLANLRLIKEKNLGPGDKVVVSRRNDVIPMVERVVLKASTKVFTPPSDCPSCGSELTMDGEYLVCKNISICPAQIKGNIYAYLQKIGVLEFGETIVDALVDNGLVRCIPDIYDLTRSDLSNLELESGRRVGEKTADTMLSNLHSKMQLTIPQFLGALGIPGISTSTIQSIVDSGYDSIDEILELDYLDLISIPGIGQSRAGVITNWFMELSETISDLIIDKGIQIIGPKKGKLTGFSFCMTGFRDQSLKEAIENNGGQVKDGVSKGLSFLIQKDPSVVSEKSKKALSYGTKIISEQDAWRMAKC